MPTSVSGLLPFAGRAYAEKGTAVWGTVGHDGGEGTVFSARCHLSRDAGEEVCGPESIWASGPEADIPPVRLFCLLSLEELMAGVKAMSLPEVRNGQKPG